MTIREHIEEIEKLYVEEKLSSVQISKIFGCSKNRILQLLWERDVPMCQDHVKFGYDKQGINDFIKDRNIILLDDYKGIDTSVEWQCLICDYQWKTSFWNIKNEHGCPNCAGQAKITIEQIRNSIMDRPLKLLSNKLYGIDGKVEWECLLCNRKWFSTPYIVINQEHGCVKCNIPRGENHSNWRGGSSRQKYPSEWTDELRESIRNRDQRKCKYPDCNYEDTKELRKLSVHHIDGNKDNCEQWNLISLCVKHHSKIEWDNPESWQDYFYQITSDYR